MKLRILNTSIVAIVPEADASKLHDARLKALNIVPKDWRPHESAITTALVSTVPYTNGIIFTMEQNKMQVFQNTPKPDESLLPELLYNWLKNSGLATACSAVGVNITAIVECDDPGEFIRTRFFKEDVWGSEKAKPSMAGFRLIYDLADGRLIIAIDVAEATTTEGEQFKGILLLANYNRDLSTSASSTPVRRAIYALPRRLEHFTGLVNSLLKLEA